MSRPLRVGTRGSQLARYQAHAVASLIAASGGPPCEIVVIKTSGDRLQDVPLSTSGGKRLFVKEIEDALLSGEIDLAVHSSKDLPGVLPARLAIGGVLPRADPHDVMVLPGSHEAKVSTIDDVVAVLGRTPALGTGSIRRKAQLVRLFPGAVFSEVRGNVDTRLRKLDEGRLDALVLAAAGLRRLGFESRISFRLPLAACLPAPGQGIIAVEIRTGDETAGRVAAAITDPTTAAALGAERALVEALGGECQTPLGALASPLDDSTLELVAIVVAPDGSRAVRAADRGPSDNAGELGRRVAGQLLASGAGEILSEAGAASTGRVTPNQRA